MKRRNLCAGLAVVLGAGAIALAMAAGPIGLDPDQRWGPFRTGLLLLGILWVVLLGSLSGLDRLDRHMLARRGQTQPAGRGESRGANPHERRRRHADEGSIRNELERSPLHINLSVVRGVGLGVFLVFSGLLYSWYASASLMTAWPETTSVYATLGESFLQGRLDLLEDPSPALAQLENPYDPAQRKGIPIVPDASYYKGRYYLYWGPVPGIVAALWKLASGSAAGDQGLAFVGHVFVLLFTTAILVALRDRYFSGLPTWLLGVGLVVAAVAHPMLWNLSYPDIYVAAIAWGQACLVGGLFVALPVILGTETDWRKLALAGVLWSLAIGSRYTLAPAVLVCVLMTAVGTMKSKPSKAHLFRLGIAIGLPFVLIVTALGAYNVARFGRAAETGLQYQMTPSWDYTAIARAGGIFSVRYIVPNLIYYGISPFKIRAEFPFLGAQRGESTSVRAFLRAAEIPKAYSVEDINGLLLAVPFSLFGLFWVVRPACRIQPGEQDASTASPQGFRDRRDLERTSLSLLLAAGTTGLLILAYRHVANRFIMDFSPFLIIAAVLGAWELRTVNRGRPILGPLSIVLILVVAAAAVAASVLLGVGGPASRIDDYNPALWALLSGLGR